MAICGGVDKGNVNMAIQKQQNRTRAIYVFEICSNRDFHLTNSQSSCTISFYTGPTRSPETLL